MAPIIGMTMKLPSMSQSQALQETFPQMPCPDSGEESGYSEPYTSNDLVNGGDYHSYLSGHNCQSFYCNIPSIATGIIKYLQNTPSLAITQYVTLIIILL